MKNHLIFTVSVLLCLSSCDKVGDTYPPTPNYGDWELYPNGDSTHYIENEWPTFSANTNALRNVLIEDYTGHRCNGCPAAAIIAKDIEEANPNRVFISAVHAGPNGTGSLQALLPSEGYVTEFFNSATHELGRYFGADWPNSNFWGNPHGAISRVRIVDPNVPMEAKETWANTTNTLITANDLKVNLQAASNFYPSTRGLFLHVEVEKLDQSLLNDLNLVVQLHEDSTVAKQTNPGGSYPNYVHRHTLRGMIDGKTFGKKLTAEHMDANGKYYYNYIYELPEEYTPDNAHLLIYVRDAVTEEIYQVIKQKIE